MKILLLLDYDGTLTSIKNKPRHATLSPARKKILAKLTKDPNIKVIIVSGRKLSNVKKIIGIPSLTYVGNHGFEYEFHGKYKTYEKAKKIVPILKTIHKELSDKLRFKGLLIEDKEFTLSVHFRMVKGSDLKNLSSTFSKIVAPWKSKVKITKGKKVFEIRPPFDWDKGKSVLWIIKKMKLKKYFPIYIGDDQTDEDAFKALKGKGLSIIVGDKRKTNANYRINSINKVYGFFEYLLSHEKNEEKFGKKPANELRGFLHVKAKIGSRDV